MTEPYYSDDLVTLYHGDCREITAWLGADVLVTDPPYGIGWSKHGISRTFHGDRVNGNFNGTHRPHQQIRNDTSTQVRDEALELWGDRPAFVFGSLKMSPPEKTRHVAVYVKPTDAGSLSGVATLRRDVEAIYLLGDSEEWTRQAIDDLDDNRVSMFDAEEVPTKRSRSSMAWTRRPPSRWRSSVFATAWKVAGTRHGLAARSGHPHAKPTDVLGELIALHSGTVADPFAGSGSTLVAARAAGRKAVGVELDEKYCEVAARRLSEGELFAKQEVIS